MTPEKLVENLVSAIDALSRVSPTETRQVLANALREIDRQRVVDVRGQQFAIHEERATRFEWPLLLGLRTDAHGPRGTPQVVVTKPLLALLRTAESSKTLAANLSLDWSVVKQLRKELGLSRPTGRPRA